MNTPIELFFVKKAFDLIKILGERLVELRRKRTDEINRIEKTFGNLDYLVPYYVVPHAQNVNPADFDEDDTGLIARNNVFDLLDQFLAGPPRYSHAFILSDAGMGKTSLLVMLELFYLNKFIQSDFNVNLYKLGSETIDEISKIESPQNTVLLLDALDEDQEAWESFYNRMQLLLQSTQSFRKVIITCRTQFFPIEHEEDGRIPGVVVLSGFYCSKIFLSPFTDEQVKEYLQKRFNVEKDRKKALKIVTKMHSLKFRPMLLSYVDFFLDKTHEFNDAYTVYKVLVDEWLNRELRKGVITNKSVIFEVCTNIANYMYKGKKRAIEFTEVRDHYMESKNFRSLEYMTIEGRSLLHRNSEGNFKFAHYSILEFFVAQNLLKDPNNLSNTDQVIRFIEDMLVYHDEKNASGINLSKVRLRGRTLPNVNFSGSVISGGDFEQSTLNKADFTSVQADGADFKGCQLSKTKFIGAKCDGSTFSNCVMNKSLMRDANFNQCDFDMVDLSESDLTNTSFVGGLLNKSILDKSELRGAKFNDCKMLSISIRGGCNISSVDFTNANMNGANLEDAIIQDCKFTGATLFEAKLSGVVIRNSNFENAHLSATLSNTKFDNVTLDKITADRGDFTSLVANYITCKDARLNGCRFDDSRISESDFTNALLDGASFNSSNISNSDMTGLKGSHISAEQSHIAKCTFKDAIIANIRLNQSNISGSTFEDAYLPSAYFANAVIKNTTMRRCTLTSSVFSEATLDSINFNGASLVKGRFDGARLKGGDFSNAILDGVIFAGASFENMNFHMARFNSETQWPDGQRPKDFVMLGPGITMRGQKLQNRDLTTADFSGANMTGSDFSGSNLSKASFKGANLERCDFTGANLAGANFAGAKLDRCNLVKAVLTGTDLTNASMTGALYNVETKFPEGLNLIDKNMRTVVS